MLMIAGLILRNNLHLARKYAQIFVREHYQFLFVGTDYVQGKLSERIFAPNGGYHVYVFRDTPSFENWVFPSFSW